MNSRFRIVLAALALAGFVGVAGATSVFTSDLDVHVSGGTIAGMPDYNWWYGCSPTSVGMILGKYDRDGYQGADYSNICAGTVAEATRGTVAQDLIASAGNIADFYSGGTDATGDDVATLTHTFDCLADFMGTSQDGVAYNFNTHTYNDNANGGTTFYYYNNGTATSYSLFGGTAGQDGSGTYGIYEYLVYSGYGSAVIDIYNQYIDTFMSGVQGAVDSFTFVDFMAEIDAGRACLIQVEGHTMMGYGYDEPTQTIYIDDTWGAGTSSMTWGGSYSGRAMYGVTVIKLAAGDGTAIPEPATLSLFGLAVAAGAVIRRRRAA